MPLTGGWLTGAMVSPNPRRGAVILAAGGSSRFGGAAKQLVSLGGRPLVRIALDAALDAAADTDLFEAVAVVEGAVDLGGIVPEGVVRLENPDWGSGQASSVQVAVQWALDSGFDSLVVGLADQPGVTADAWRLVAGATGAGPIVIATYDGTRGNPVRLDRAVWSSLPTTGDEGARSLARKQPELVREVPCPGTMLDIDTLEDLDRWN